MWGREERKGKGREEGGGGEGGEREEVMRIMLVYAELKLLAPIPSPLHPFPTHRWVTVLDSNGNSVIMWTLIQQFHAVALSSDGRGKVDGDHLKEGISCWEPATHDCLQQWFSLLLLHVGGKDGEEGRGEGEWGVGTVKKGMSFYND